MNLSRGQTISRYFSPWTDIETDVTDESFEILNEMGLCYRLRSAREIENFLNVNISRLVLNVFYQLTEYRMQKLKLHETRAAVLHLTIIQARAGDE